MMKHGGTRRLETERLILRRFTVADAGAVFKYLFEGVVVNRMAAMHSVDNPKSGRVMQKLGMVKEGVLRQAARSNHGLEDVVQYSLLASEYQPKNP